MFLRLCPLFLCAIAVFAAPQNHQNTFQPFTGKVTAKKVRLRLEPTVESHVLKQVQKNDLFLVVGEQNDFYAICPPQDAKAYIFRSYVLDGTVEADRVNIRLEPHLDAPIIGQLKMGDKVRGTLCSSNHKWLEIPMPQTTRFFIAKEYLSVAGSPDHLVSMQKRKAQVEELLNSAFILAQAECKKIYEEMSIDPIIAKLQTILDHFPDFPAENTQAKEAIILLKDTYLQKKITYLEGKAELTNTAKEELLKLHKQENEEILSQTNLNPHLWNERTKVTRAQHPVHVWDDLEESLYISWSAFHNEKKMGDFYQEQRANAQTLTGMLEAYDSQVKNKPGDYILKGSQLPMAFLYSTHVNLEQYVGQTVTLSVAPRPNNHFAFPAYFVLSVE